jgi:hypothetical protein
MSQKWPLYTRKTLRDKFLLFSLFNRLLNCKWQAKDSTHISRSRLTTSMMRGHGSTLNIIPKQLTTDAGWNGYDNPRPPSDPPNGPFAAFGHRFGLIKKVEAKSWVASWAFAVKTTKLGAIARDIALATTVRVSSSLDRCYTTVPDFMFQVSSFRFVNFCSR